MKRDCILTVVALSLSAGAFAQDRKPDPKLQVYLCFGQSNMEAGARPEELDKGDVDPRFQMLNIQGIEYKEVERPGLPPTPATPPAAGAVAESSSQAVAAEATRRTVEDGGTGPCKALMATNSTLPTHTIFRPKDLSAFGEKHKLPIIVWGSGACANSPWEHVNFLSEVASHGFLVIAIGPMPTEGLRGGPGGSTKSSLVLDAINWAGEQDRDEKSHYHRRRDTAKIAAGGMSCGGLQALEVAPDPRVTTAIIRNSGILGNPGGGMRGMPNLTKKQIP